MSLNPVNQSECLGDCGLSYMEESPAAYTARTGMYRGVTGEAALILSPISFYVDGKLVGNFTDLSEARLHMKSVAKLATFYPIGKA